MRFGGKFFIFEIRICLNMKNVFSVLIAVMAGLSVFAQNIADTLHLRLEGQYYEYPQEKVHLMTDRNHYMGGDTIWFRGFVVSSATHEPVAVSKYMYVELRTPYNTVDQRIKVIERGGVYAGYVPLDMRVPEGDYTLVAYTNFMNSAGEAYFFKKPVNIRNAYSLRMDLSSQFEWEDGGGRLVCRIDYRDRTTGEERERKFTYRTIKDADWRPSWRKSGTETVKLDREEYMAGYLLVMCDDYAKYIRLPKNENGFDVTFHPEGGYLVPGEECRVAFKAIDGYGDGIAVHGRVIDSRNNEVVKFKSLHGGMGVLTFTPRLGETYRAECVARDSLSASFDLPAVNGSAAVVSADLRGDSVIDLRVNGRCPGDAIVAIQERGLLVYAGRLGGSREISIGCGGLQSGVVQVLLLDGGLNALSERLLFVRAADTCTAAVAPARPTYGSRDKVILNLRLDGYANAEGDVAVSVTDRLFGDETGGGNILSNLLLQSELRGYIENPAYYFEADDSVRRAALDALLLTQGWRRYDIPASLRGEYQYPAAAIEKSQQISGTVKSLWRGKPLADATVKILSKKLGFARAVKTDSVGRFYFKGFDNADGATYQLEAVNKNGNTESNVEIDYDIYPAIEPIDAIVDYKPTSNNEDIANNDDDAVEQMRLSASGVYNIILNELVVEGHAPQFGDKSITEIMASKTFDGDYFEEEGVTTLEEIIRKLPGVLVKGNGDVVYRNRPVMFLVDEMVFSPSGTSDAGDIVANYGENRRRRARAGGGAVAEASFAAAMRALSYPTSSRGMLREVEDAIPFDMIKQVSFLPPNATLTFSMEGNAAIAIDLKEGAEIGDEKPYGMKYIMPLGYQQPAEFYSPKYAKDFGNNSDGGDLRSTVYWNPDVKIDADGNAMVEFYANDNRNTRYDVLVEGVTGDGELVHTTTQIRKR